jgi:hypothetical protein
MPRNLPRTLGSEAVAMISLILIMSSGEAAYHRGRDRVLAPDVRVLSVYVLKIERCTVIPNFTKKKGCGSVLDVRTPEVQQGGYTHRPSQQDGDE